MAIIYGDDQDVTVQNSNIFLGLPVLNPNEPTGGETLVGVWHTNFTVTDADGILIGFDLSYPSLVPATVVVNYGDDSFSGGNAPVTIFGDTKSLTLSAIAPDVSVPDVTDVNDIQIDLYSVMHREYNFGDDSMNFGNGSNTFYGDTGNLSLIATGGSVAGGAVVGGMVYANTFNFGVDTITSGGGANVVFGDTQDILLSGRDGNDDASFTSTSFGLVVGNTISSAVDTISLGNGDNIVYGDSRDITLEGISGFSYNSQDGTNASQDGGGIVQNNTLNFAGDTITVGNGVNVIYGDGRDVNYIGDGGSAKNDALSFIESVGFDETPQLVKTNGGTILNTLTAGDDAITIGTGFNTVCGDFHNINFTALITGSATGSADISGTTASQSADIYGFMFGETVTMGNDLITQTSPASVSIGSIVSGDIWDLTKTLVNTAVPATGAAEGSVEIRFGTLTAGDDIIQLGNGGNSIYGDLHDYIVTQNPGTDASGWIFENAESSHRFEALLGGSDDITSGSGADNIYGDMRNVTWSANGGTTQTGTLQTRIQANTVSGGDDTIHAGGGIDNVYGDWQDINITLQGGTILPETNPAIDPMTLFAYIDAPGNIITGGDDFLYGEGGNDTIYGDGKSLSISLFGGNTSSLGGTASVHLINSTITFGNDLIDGGSGNDFLYGDVKDITFVAQAGTGAGDVSASFSGSYTRINNVHNFNVVRVDNGSTLTFGNDTLVGGAGNDFLAGDAVNLTGLDSFLADLNPQANISNKVIWGNDTLTGGTGADQFAFTLLNDGHFEMQGQDTITDFSLAQGDRIVLMVAEGVTYADLNADTVFNHPNVNHSGPKDTIINFHDGLGSITLYDVDLASFSAANTVLVH